jgi:hypothetical protein
VVSDDGVIIKYCLHRPDKNPRIIPGSYVVGTDGLCPRFEPCDNSNLFRHHFGLEFHHEGHTYMRAISPFEFARCYNLEDDITYRISHQSNIFCLNAAVPGRTSAHIFDQLLARLVRIRDANCSLFSPNQYAALAACAQAFLNGAVGIRLPDKAQWVEAYSRDPVMKYITGFVTNPGTISNKALKASGIPCPPSPLAHCPGRRTSHILQANRRIRVVHPLTAHPIGVLQYSVHRVPHEPNWRALQHLPHPSLHAPSVLLARNV